MTHKPQDAQFVWFDHKGAGRNLYAMFRRSFDLDAAPKAAVINLFADSHYQLFVNGVFVEFGPARFDPRFPQYDTIDITRHLKRGANAIAVLVNSFQHKVYKAISHCAGFVAWGTVESAGGGAVDLATAPRTWRCIRDMARTRYAGKFSFALSAAELYDQAGELPGWNDASFDDSAWPFAVPLDDQGAWGPLEPRSIPFMSGAGVAIPKVKHVLPLATDEDLFSFSLPCPHHLEDDKAQWSGFVAFTSWIYSPGDQEVVAGTFWGDSWINGERVPRGVESVEHPMRISQHWQLKTGWNHFFGMVGAYQDVVEMYFALPRGKGIFFAADKCGKPAVSFKHSRILSMADYERHLKNKPMPYAPDDDLAEAGGWIAVDASTPAQSPSREMSWDVYGDAVEQLSVDGLRGHVFKLADYPNGFSLLLDMEYIRLVFPRLQLSGVAGATIDLGYTEHLWRDNMHLRLQHNYVATDRLLCSRDTIDWLCPHPRGFRYLMITVRNAASDVVLRDIALRSAGYPVKHTGSFKCSDKLLTAVWEMGALTQETNMEDAYVDCVGRERGMYGRDTIIQYHVNLAAFGDHALMGRCMQLYGQSPDPTGKFRAVYPNTGDYTIADFALNMVEGYLNYYENSGDLDRIREDWDAIMKNMAWFSSLSDERKDLLLDGEWHLHKGIKAHYGGFHGDLTSDGYMSKKGIHCSFTCTYLIALKSAIKLGKLLGESEAVKDMERRVKILSQSIRTKFWNPKKRCFSDNLKRETHSAHASILAVLAGAVSKQQLPHVRAHIANELKSIFVNGYDPKDGAICSPNYAFYLFDGVYRLGLPETAEGMMRQGWGWMLAQGMKTCGEYFTLGSSLCHAWSAAPTYYLSRNVLGVHYPNAPECGIVEIRVAASKDVTWAEGAYPHPKGAIKVKWHMENGRRVFDHVKAPRGVTVRVAR